MATVSSSELSRLRIDRDGPSGPPRRLRRPRRWLGRLLLLAILGGTGWLLWPFVAPRLAQARAPVVETGQAFLLRPGANLELTTASGYVVARTRAALAAKVAGRITALEVDVGDAVGKGQLIARIDPQAFQHRVEQEEALLAQARSEETSAAIQVSIAKRAVERFAQAVAEAEAAVKEIDRELVEAERVLANERRLLESGSGLRDVVERMENEVARLGAVRARRGFAVTSLEVERASAEASVRGAEARVQLAAEKTREAEARLAMARVDLSDTEIRAPFAGIVLRKEAELGEIVVPALAGGTTSRGAVVTLADFSTLEMEVDVFERDIGLLREQGEAWIHINAIPELRLAGRVRQIVPTADRTKGTVQVKVAFTETDPRVVPEMGGKVSFLREKPEGELRPEVQVPRRALVTWDGRTGVWILDRDRVRFRAVSCGEERGERIVVLGGLSGGETVVLDPDPALGEGMLVRRKET
jgi:HlyD family secretion protein